MVKDGLRFPTVGLDNPSAVTSILLQQPGKLKAKQIREGKKMGEFLAKKEPVFIKFDTSFEKKKKNYNNNN